MIPRKFSGRLRVLDEHYRTAFKDPFEVVSEQRYGQLKVPKLKLCKCAVASIVNRFQKYITSRCVRLGPSQKYPWEWVSRQNFFWTKKRDERFILRFWSKFRFRQKWCQIKGLGEYFQKMAIKNLFGPVKTCFGYNIV